MSTIQLVPIDAPNGPASAEGDESLAAASSVRRPRARRRIAIDRDMAWACLRCYLGVALVIKSFVYLVHGDQLLRMMQSSGVPYASSALAQLVAVVHLAGGLMLAFGLRTRIAAAIQIPNVLGAIVYVHWRAGLFGTDQSLELTTFVLVVLLLFAAVGGGSWSVDGAFERQSSRSMTQNVQREG